MADGPIWIWVVVGIIAFIAFAVSIGEQIHRRTSTTSDEHRRALQALKSYEEQQRSWEDQHLRVEQQLDRQEALVKRIERLVDRWEGQIRSETPNERGT